MANEAANAVARYLSSSKARTPVNVSNAAPQGSGGYGSALAGVLHSKGNTAAYTSTPPAQPDKPQEDESVIQHIMDALGVGMYSAANTVNNVVDAVGNIKDGNFRGYTDLAMAPLTGLGQGLSAAAGNHADAKTFSKVIKNVNDRLGNEYSTDPNALDYRKLAEGVGGFLGDVALDPLNYVGIGEAPAIIKGISKGVSGFKEESALAKATGSALRADVKPSLWENVKTQAKISVDDYKAQEAANKVGAKLNKLKTPEDKANWLQEHFHALPDAVQKKVAPGVADPAKLIDEMVSVPKGKTALDDSVIKPDVVDQMIPTPKAESAPETVLPEPMVPPEPVPNPNIGLSDFKPVTPAQRIADALNGFRGTTKEKVYNDGVIQRVRELQQAKPERIAVDSPVASQVPDLAATVSAMQKMDKEFGGGTSFPYKGADGKTVYSSLADTVEALKDPVTGPKVFSSLDKELRKYKAGDTAEAKTVVNKGRMTDADYTKLGIAPEHIKAVRAGNIDKITADLGTSGDVRKITRDMRSGVISPDALKPFYEHTGTTDPKKIAKFIDSFVKTDAYKTAADDMAAYGGKRLENQNNTLGAVGHGNLAQPTELHSLADIIASKTPTDPVEARAFLEAKYTQASQKLINHANGVDFRIIADKVFENTVKNQMKEAGPARTMRGASVNEAKTEAKFETKYNTQSTIDRTTEVVNEARLLYPTHGVKDARTFNALKKQQDEAIVTIMRDVDARLRLAGFDLHLSNMAKLHDPLIVRLGPSDILDLLPQQTRIKYLWGNGPKGAINEILPTSMYDMAEILVRSITKLSPEGKIDVVRMADNAYATITGVFGGKNGMREIANNLDSLAYQKNISEIIRAIDPEAYGAYKAAGGDMAKKQSVMDAVIAAHPGEVKKLVEKRADNAVELYKIFTGGILNGEPSVLTDLININMQNASVFAGNVTKPILESTAEHSARVLEALEKGTSGDYISALVAKPVQRVSMVTNDAAARKVATAEWKLSQEGYEGRPAIDHVTAAQANVRAESAIARDEATVLTEVRSNRMAQRKAKERANAAGEKLRGTKNNVRAYQRDPEMAALEKEAVIPAEHYFDLATREAGADVLFRMGWLPRFFSKRHGMDLTFDTVAGSTHVPVHLMTGLHGLLRQLTTKGYTTQQLGEAFNVLKVGPPTDQISGDLNAVLSTVFDSSTSNLFTRNSIGPDHFNKVLASVGFKDSVRIPENLSPGEIRNIWKTWDVHDPVDFFSKFYGAMIKASEDVSMGASFSKKFGKAEWEPGYVKLIDKSGKNEFLPLIDRELFYPEVAANEMVHLGKLITESRAFKRGTQLHTFVTQIMDPTISILKMTQTTMKPGHSVMSLVGDMWRNDLALATIKQGGPAHQMKLYGEIGRIMRSNGIDLKELSEFQKFKRIQGVMHDLPIGEDMTKPSEWYGNIAGGGQIAHSDVYALMQAGGAAPPAHLGGVTTEDFLSGDNILTTPERAANKVARGVAHVSNTLDRVMNPVKPKFGMKQPYSVNRFTANRDTFTRGQLWLGAFRSRQFASVTDAAEYANQFVRKWSMTAIDMSAKESKYARRAFFYYTWQRGMVPRIIEAALIHPGRATLPSKAMYNLAVYNGIDPQSLGDPFPADQLMPSWYGAKVLGPQMNVAGDMWGFNPTGPVGDTLNSLGSGVKPADFLTGDAYSKVVGSLLSMSNPFFKAPAELTLGHSLDSAQIPITDKLQYLQDIIGPLRTASMATGKDFYPAVGSQGQVGLPNRTEKKYANGGATKPVNSVPNLLNWATGLQVTNYTSDSASKSAQFQAKDKAKTINPMDARLK